MTLYADRIFFEGFIMDAVTAYFVSVIMREYLKPKKIIFFSALSALADTVSMCVFILNPPAFIFSALAANCILSFLLFRPKGARRLIETTVLTIIFSALLYGFLIWVKRMSNIPQAIGFCIKNNGRLTVMTFIFTAGTAFLFLRLCGKWLESSFFKRPYYCKTELLRNGMTAKITALIDTGCFATDRKDGAVIIFTEKNELIKLFSDEERDAFICGKYSVCEGVSYIDIASIGNKSQNIPLLKLDCAKAVLSGGEKISFENAKAAVFYGRFSSSGGYHAIISAGDIDKWRRK